MKKLVLVLACLVICSAFVVRELATAAPALKTSGFTKWEYKVLEFKRSSKPDDWEKQLNELGADGWELVSISQAEVVAPGGVFQINRAIVKRPKS